MSAACVPIEPVEPRRTISRPWLALLPESIPPFSTADRRDGSRAHTVCEPDNCEAGADVKSARAAVAAMLSVCAVVLAMLGVWWSAPAASLGGSVDPGPGQSSPAGPGARQSSPVSSGPGQALSVVSLAPGIAWAGLSYQATLVVQSSGLVPVENISVAVQAASGARFDFPGMHPAVVDG